MTLALRLAELVPRGSGNAPTWGALLTWLQQQRQTPLPVPKALLCSLVKLVAQLTRAGARPPYAQRDPLEPEGVNLLWPGKESSVRLEVREAGRGRLVVSGSVTSDYETVNW